MVTDSVLPLLLPGPLSSLLSLSCLPFLDISLLFGLTGRRGQVFLTQRQISSESGLRDGELVFLVTPAHGSLVGPTHGAWEESLLEPGCHISREQGVPPRQHSSPPQGRSWMEQVKCHQMLQ